MNTHPPSVSAPARRPVASGALTAAAIVAGWCAHDLLVFLDSGEPGLCWRILPGSLAGVLAGAVLGALWSRSRRLLLVFVLALGAASVAPRFLSVELAEAQRWLPRVCLLIAALWAVWSLGPVRRRTGGVCFGLAVGLLACVAVAAYRTDLEPVSRVALGGGVVALLASFAPRASLRRVGTLAMGAPLVIAVPDALGASRPSRVDLAPPAAAAPAPAPATNLLLVVLDTVRADHLAPYGYERVTTPRLDAWAERSAVRFTQARSASSWTLPSHATLLTGRMPAEHGATHLRVPDDDATVYGAATPARRLRDDVPTLAERLRARGYRTGAILGNSVYLRSEFGLHRGFEHYDDRVGGWVHEYVALVQFAGYRLRAGHLIYREARDITDLALRWSEGVVGAPYFLLLNYMDAHGPYHPPAPFDRAFSDRRPVDPFHPRRGLFPLLYDRELRYLDSELGRLLDELERRGLLEDTLVVVTADHGEGFGEHGVWRHDWVLYDEMVRVPLYVRPPGGRPAPVADEPIDGVGVHDLVARALGLEPPAERPPAPAGEWFRMPDQGSRESPDGRDMQRDLVFWVEGTRKTIVSSRGDVEAFDLASDPEETRPLDLDQAEVRAARERARAWWEAHPPPAPDAAAIDGDSMDRLRGLGYAGGERGS